MLEHVKIHENHIKLHLPILKIFQIIRTQLKASIGCSKVSAQMVNVKLIFIPLLILFTNLRLTLSENFRQRCGLRIWILENSPQFIARNNEDFFWGQLRDYLVDAAWDAFPKLHTMIRNKRIEMCKKGIGIRVI